MLRPSRQINYRSFFYRAERERATAFGRVFTGSSNSWTQILCLCGRGGGGDIYLTRSEQTLKKVPDMGTYFTQLCFGTDSEEPKWKRKTPNKLRNCEPHKNQRLAEGGGGKL